MSNKNVAKRKAYKKDTSNEKHILKLEKENRRLKAENKTLQDALNKTDAYLIDMFKDKSVEEVVQNVKEKSDVIVQEKCPNCGVGKMKRINLGIAEIIACTKCPYRNRLNESGPSQT